MCIIKVIVVFNYVYIYIYIYVHNNVQDGQGKTKDKEVGEHQWPPSNICKKEKWNYEKSG